MGSSPGSGNNNRSTINNNANNNSDLPAAAAATDEVIPSATSPANQNQRKRKFKVVATANPSHQQIINYCSNSSTMAISCHNPQDPEAACSVTATSAATAAAEEYSKQHSPAGGKRKPSRALLYLRNRARGPATNLSVVVVATVLMALSVHRVISLWATHRRWINAPITYMHRECPAFDYEPLAVPGDGDAAAKPKICLTTLTDQKSPSKFQRFMRWRNFDGILELTWENKKKYADRHGYHLFDGSRHIDSGRPPAWSKIKAVQHLLEEEGCDWVMWTDADTVIMNSKVAVTDFLPADPTKDLLVGSDKGGGYNSGVFLFRNTEWSRRILQQWWDMREFVRPPGLSLSGDNAALKALLAGLGDDGFAAHVLSPPRCTFNSFAKFLTLGQSLRIMDHLEEQEWYLDHEHYHKGDFIAHTPGVDNKAECLKLLLQEAR